jgi:hypothetical protein
MRRLVIAVLGAVLVVAALAPPASAHHRPSSYCSPTGDYCQWVTGHGPKLILRAFSFRGRVTICVEHRHDEADCRSSRLRPSGNGLRQSTINWRRRFPNRGGGAYTVRWEQHGFRIGHALGFHRPSGSTID